MDRDGSWNSSNATLAEPNTKEGILNKGFENLSNDRKALIRVSLIATFVSCASGCFGFDTGSIGAIIAMPQFIEQFGEQEPLLRGFIVACILVPSALTGMIGGSISDKISRKRTIALGCAIFAIGSAMSAGANQLWVLIFARCIAGFGEGLFLSCLSVYVVEISPLRIRGKLVGMIQIATTAAIAVGYFVCYGSVKILDSNLSPNMIKGLSWRLPFIIQAVSATILAIGVPFLPYSPRWLVMKGRKEEAEQVLHSLIGHVSDKIRNELLVDGVEKKEHPKFLAIFKKDVRRRTLLGAFLNCAQQLSGIDFVLYFSPLLFAQAGLDPTTSSFFASGITGVALLVATMVAWSYVDKVGRRRLFLIGGLIVAAAQFGIGIIYASGGNSTKAGQYLVIFFIEIFALGFSGTWSMIIRLYASEIQPSHTRSAASAFGQGANQAVNFVVAVTGPLFLAKSSFGPFFTYASFSLSATILAYFVMPETIGKSLESIDASFDSTVSSSIVVPVPWPEFSKGFLGIPPSDRIRRRSSTRNSSMTMVDGDGSRNEFRTNLKMGRLF